MAAVKTSKFHGWYFRTSSNRFQILRRPIHGCHYLWPTLISPLFMGQELFSTSKKRPSTSKKRLSTDNHRATSSFSPFRQRRGNQNNRNCSGGNSSSNYNKCDNSSGSRKDYDSNKKNVVRPYSDSLPSPGYEWCRRCNIPDKRYQKKIAASNRCLNRPRIFGLGICDEAKQYYRQQFYILVFVGIFCFGGICVF